ncbi:hypothetical protein EOD10_00390 [Mesorhizobium sp. M7A.T.Ca.TU.009.01.3.2]|nr:hypothetical protein EOD10_00390 [Mesorhizobium sp. M7A.T.Ca.TU.009.01.3.2]
MMRPTYSYGLAKSICSGLQRADKMATWSKTETSKALAIIIWHMRIKDSDYVWDRPALLASKLRPADPLAARQDGIRGQRR